jgi:predicted RNA-binding protein Jag
MKHIKKFNESESKTIFSGETKNGWKYNIVTINDSRDELQLTSERGEVLDSIEMLHEAVYAYIDGNASTKGFFVDVEDITEAYDKMYELMDRGSSLDGLVDMEDI